MNEYEIKFSHEISIDQKNIKDECEKFLRTLIDDTKKFKENHDKYKNDYKQIKKSENVIYTPENVLNSSPVTLIDAKWGSGKTYFIEQLCAFISNESIKLDYIDKIIIIDVWKYSSSSLIPNDFVSYLIEKLASGYKKRRLITNSLISVINAVPLNMANKVLCTNIKIKKIKEPSIDKCIKILNKHISKPILIVLDNIERIGSNWWDIIKIIQKLVVLDNFIFVLPVFKDKLELSNGSEWSIDKYITMPSYKLKNNYCGVLNNYFDEEYLEILNNILNKTINNEQLNLRQLDNVLKNKDIKTNFINKYDVLLWFKNIWNPKEYIGNNFVNTIENILSKDIDDKLSHICINIVKIYAEISSNYPNLKNRAINIHTIMNPNITNVEYRFISEEILEMQRSLNELLKNKNLLDDEVDSIKWINSSILAIKENKNISYLDKMAKLVYDDYLQDLNNNHDEIRLQQINLKYKTNWIETVKIKIKEDLI